MLTPELERLAESSGIALAAAEGTRELGAVNNNSICRTLNPAGIYENKCAAFCGAATDEVAAAGGAVSYTCHAGLECRAIPFGGGKVLIAGRAFAKAEDYRDATERAMTGEWSKYSPSEFFENVLLTTSAANIDHAAQEVIKIVSKGGTHEAPAPERTSTPKPLLPEQAEKQETRAQGSSVSPAVADSSAWRSFFGSILKADYPAARASVLDFLAEHFQLAGLIWLERVDRSLEGVAGVGTLAGRKVKLGIAADDHRLLAASEEEMPLILGEKNGKKGRTMCLFPIGVGGDVSAAIATLDHIERDDTKHQIARMCLSVGPQLEILRLRTEVERREKLSNVVRRMSESMSDIDAEDFWIRLTQNAAEMLEAERASLLIYDERAEEFDIKAMIGARKSFDPAGAGDRVARHVLGRRAPVVIGDVSRTQLPPAPEDRRYKHPSFMSCPVSIGDRAIGVMSFTDRASGTPFDEGSLELYEAIAPQLAVAVDRARLKERAGEFEQLSVTDALTGLLNRRYIEQRLNEEVKRSNRHGFPMSFMMLDVDHFKSYNDEFGHPAGDEALKIVGSVIRDTLRAADVAARFGGEEFSILLPQTMPDEAAVIADRIRANIERTRFPHRRVTISIGVASCSADLCSSENIVDAADKALYEAKRRGRNQICTFENMGAARIG